MNHQDSKIRTMFTPHGLEISQEYETIERAELRPRVAQFLAQDYRLATCFAIDDGPSIRVIWLFLRSNPDTRRELTLVLQKADLTLDSLAELSFPAGRWERELHDLFGITAINHPLPQRLIRHSYWPVGYYPMRTEETIRIFKDDRKLGFPFLEVSGPGVYEIPVGPIHAGLIEPGHFRFSAVGETIVALKIRLWFLHKGLEKLFHGLDFTNAIKLAEKISGDTSFGHSLATTSAIEDSLGVVPDRSVAMKRALLLELERIYNHIGDVGAMANDVGFPIANSHAGELRERMLRINKTITGHRLLRGTLSIGNITLLSSVDLGALSSIADSFEELCHLITNNAMVRDRFLNTATLNRASIEGLGCLGIVAKASGIQVDARLDHPTLTLPVKLPTATRGDVLARFEVRREETLNSFEIIRYLVQSLEGQKASEPNLVNAASPRHSGVGIVEGWRGTICHRVELDSARKTITRCKIVDPSWFNWPALPIAIADTIVPDFPLVNKSFNLSYSGNDL